MDDAARLRLLAPPAWLVSMVLDTDTANEIDDHFAVAWALLAADRLHLEAIYAAPLPQQSFQRPRRRHAQSLAQIRNYSSWPLAAMCPPWPVLTGWLDGAASAAESPAAADLVRRANEHRAGPLYVAAIGAPTNIASAILLEPAIIERIVVIWLGGQPHDWPTAAEF